MIISHRGEHDNRRIHENTLEAFRAAAAAGVWGLECDLRFTADAVPVICHDADLLRVFGVQEQLRDLDAATLRRQCPQVPTLEEVLGEFGGRQHLMLEVKAENWPGQERCSRVLRDLLAALAPREDYHLLSLDPALFERLAFAPPDCFLPVAETNVRQMSDIALRGGYAGLGGHYLLLTNALKARHEAAGQSIGTGFPTSGNCLRRELNRGVRWIFSNHAVKLQGLRDDMLRQAG
jgi:glycerophosphoryl diester phosphodiesterase